jgi:hypothetical protein
MTARDLMYHEVATAKPVTLPVIAIDFDIEAEAKEAAERVAERRVIRDGLDAWQAIGKAESFEAWKRIGAALAVGKEFALRSSGANAAWGATIRAHSTAGFASMVSSECRRRRAQWQLS